MLKLVQVSKTYSQGNHNLSVVQKVSFDVSRGSFVTIVGPSGCGKSTLLNLIGALDEVNHGQIFFEDQDTTKFTENEKESYRLATIGMIFQSFNLIPHFTALENIEVPMVLAGIRKSERRKRSKQLLELVGLADRLHHKPNQLSGGQKQRIAIARALALDPEILLADEPTGALDSHNSELIIQLLKDINQKQGTTIIMVTHSHEIASQADHLIRMKDGQIIEQLHNTPRVMRKPHVQKQTRRMKFREALKNAFANLMKKKWRSALVSIGSSIGICGIALILALGIGVESKIKKEITPFLDPLTIQVTTNKSSNVPLNDEQLALVTKINGVQDAFQTYQMQAEIQYERNFFSELWVESAKPKSVVSQIDLSKILYGTYPQSENEIMLSKSVATKLAGQGQEVSSLIGKKLTLHIKDFASNSSKDVIPIEMTISGIRVQGALGILENSLVSYELANQLSSLSDKVKLTVQSATQVIVKDEKLIEDIQKSIEQLKLSVIPPDALIKTITKYSRITQSILSFIAGISLIVSSIMIGIVLYTSVLERTKEIGILKALGARRRDITAIFLTEAGCIGCIAGTIGLVTASGLGYIGNQMFHFFVLKNQQTFNLFVFPFTLLISSIILSTCLSICAGWLPARRASKLNPIDALKYE